MSHLREFVQDLHFAGETKDSDGIRECVVCVCVVCGSWGGWGGLTSSTRP